MTLSSDLCSSSAVCQFSVSVTYTWENKLIENKGLFWRFQSMVSWPCCFGACDEAAVHDGSRWWGKAPHFVAGTQKRRGGCWSPTVPLEGTPAVTWALPVGPTSQVPSRGLNLHYRGLWDILDPNSSMEHVPLTAFPWWFPALFPTHLACTGWHGVNFVALYALYTIGKQKFLFRLQMSSASTYISAEAVWPAGDGSAGEEWRWCFRFLASHLGIVCPWLHSLSQKHSGGRHFAPNKCLLFTLPLLLVGEFNTTAIVLPTWKHVFSSLFVIWNRAFFPEIPTDKKSCAVHEIWGYTHLLGLFYSKQNYMQENYK